MADDAAVPRLELEDIQSGVLRPRPTPYAATYILLRIDDRGQGGELLRRLGEVVTSAAAPERPGRDTFVHVALTYDGLVALGLPEASLESFSWEFRQGMLARAKALGDEGPSAPERWEAPFGGRDIHVILTGVAPSAESLQTALDRARAAFADLPGVVPIWRQDCFAPADEKEPFGFKDGISHPAIEGSGIPGTNPLEAPLKAGELVLGYLDEMGTYPPAPEPAALGRNGTYVVFRKLHQDVAGFRRYLRANSSGADDEELLAAKMMGRWRSGAPLALCPMHDDPALGGDPARNNAFLFRADDATGYRTPPGSHVRRCNPRDADVAGVVRLHRMIRRGTAYGPPLPPGVTEDDGADRGLMFAFVGAHLKRQFEFVQSEWVNGGEFLGLGDARDPICGAADGAGAYAIPRRPLPRRLQGLARFVTTRGGAYGFMPSLTALRWLAEVAAGPQ
ncbi:Dyp-type peroxidase [Phenylobacterium sp. J367]|uniref:Dyp-type peroxidase n=1 Tax=Phenylobacterium sp. J367 TaxID=2898435 RepID=UPI0021511C9D|nr:Dyp-type peroxidase [Phenylobacterium sp. J367]MCR5878892.1 Dyp-type peroxidase [Phenylobacterium sp. J367]